MTRLRRFPIQGHRFTVNSWADEWLAQVAIVRPKTFATYRHKLSFTRAVIGRKSLRRVSATDIREVITFSFDAGLSATTVQHVFRTTFTLLRAAVREDLISVNPAEKVTAPAREYFEAVTLSEKQVARLYRGALEEPFIGNLVILGMATGARIGELLALTWRDVDWATATVQITKSVRWLEGKGAVVGHPKTFNGRRSLALTVPAVEALFRQQKRNFALRDANFRNWSERGLVFPSPRGDYWSPGGTPYRRWIMLLFELGLPRIRFHDLRHTAGEIVTRNEGLLVASRILGHATPAITARFYGHVRSGDLARGVESIASAMLLADEIGGR